MRTIAFAATIIATTVTVMSANANSFGPYGPQGRAPQGPAPQAMPQPYAPQNFRPSQRQMGQPQMRHAQENAPAAKVSKQLNSLRAFLAQAQGGEIDRNQAIAYIEQQIAPDIDFDTMTKMSLGRLAMRMSPQQVAEAQRMLRYNFTTKLVDAMGNIRETRLQVGNAYAGRSNGEVVVPVRLDRWQNRPLTINFRFYKSQNGWKVFDAEAGGQSAVLFYRGWFARTMRP